VAVKLVRHGMDMEFIGLTYAALPHSPVRQPGDRGERPVLAEQRGRRVARGSVRWRPRGARPARDAPGRGSAHSNRAAMIQWSTEFRPRG
jgi:hypothetical protein